MITIKFKKKHSKFQLTASIDLIQTHFKCCAIDSNLNYDMSLWKLQNYGQRDWAVPQTCCVLKNNDDERAYLDPRPQNISLCQSLLKHEYNRARHSEACAEHLSKWYRKHYLLFITAGLVIVVVKLMILFSIILSCTKIASNQKRKNMVCRSIGTTMQTTKRRAPQPQYQQPTNDNDHCTAHSYHISNSYLI